MAFQNTGDSKNILVGASPLFLSVEDSTVSGYDSSMDAGASNTFVASKNRFVPAFVTAESYTTTLNKVLTTTGASQTASPTEATPQIGGAYRNVGFTNNGLQISYQPTYDSVTVDQLLDTAKLFKSAMMVSIATEMAEGTLENVLAVFGQQANTLVSTGSGTSATDTLGLEAGALGAAPTERQLIAVGQGPTSQASSTERVYYARRVLSVEQSQFSLARTAATTFPVTFRLLPSGDSTHVGSEYGKIIDRVLAV
ncbi:MAG: hypothetical protein D4R39_02965 [Methylophilaceae bacterium]|nr:MAG: hypothetical protein D4R39_02965 [Methylophilaceae bacterium]